ncbi:peptide-methionine (S)-S-oxide reductase MsrA [Paenibacillus alba]|uniref:peptide-methionine (S)-S-oxide reductase MsrA n=1 Tax=Paenibacillus alba TaxID=1197127 RepID=UPI001C206523|nr:peptide-methionine (S)-S-oxide reductase MsrA [Paenibacillus alba]
MNNIETLTLGMGCFWSPDALFGQWPGVVRTRVGYAGGTHAQPTYRTMGDHSETIEIDFDPQMMTMEQLLDIFWSHHQPDNINDYKGRQYQSLVLYRDERQHGLIREVMKTREAAGKRKLNTEIAPFAGFYLAEERHQKYYLKRYPDAISKLSTLYSTQDELVDSTLAARLNGLAKGYTNLQRIISEIQTWPLPLNERESQITLVKRIKW